MIKSQNFHMSKTWKNLFLLIFLFSLVFDYRRLDGDSLNFIVLLGGLSFFASLALLINIREFSKKSLYIYSFFMLFATSSCISGFLRGQEVYAILAQILPFLIFSNAFLISSNYTKDSFENLNILRIVIISGIFAACWKVFFAFSYYGLDIGSVRYQILSGATIMLFCYGIVSFFITKNKYYFISLILSLGLVLVSVTRTYIVIYIFVFLSCLMSLPYKNFAKTIYKISVAFFFIILILWILITLNPVFEERWLSRLFINEASGNDLTALTRISEAKGQLELMSNDIFGALFGFGISAKTYWSGQEVNEIINILGSKFDTSGYSYGHNLYIGILYVGGIIFGIPVIFILMFLPILALIKFKKLYGKLNVNQKNIGLFAICSAFGYLFYGFLAGTFGDRSMSLYYGLIFGFLVRFLYLKI